MLRVLRPRRGSLAPSLLLGLWLPALVGCDDAAVQRCHAEMSTAQATLLAMDAGDRAQVDGALGGVRRALGSCREAKRGDEVKELEEAEANLAGHLKALEARAARGAPHQLSEAELAKLVREGDPACPRGHAYEHGDSKKTIRCTGPQLFEMSFEQIREHYSRRGFSLAVDPQRRRIRAEYGAEVAIFDFAEPDSKERATCMTLAAAPGVPWQELVTRATGVPPARLTEGKSLVLDGRQVPLRLEGSGADKTVHLGTCPAPTEAPAAAPATP